jgi:NADH:ubiquinone reductase (H+-translocating)
MSSDTKLRDTERREQHSVIDFPSRNPSSNPAGDSVTSRQRHRIVVVGGGAGGLELATRLGDKYHHSDKAEVVLVDRSPTHVWKPLLHEVAAGSMDANTNQLEYIAQARWHHFEFQQGDLTGLDRARKTITVSEVHDVEGVEILPEREVPYDTLVLAIGSVTNFFNTRGAREHAIAVDTVSEAEHFRRRLIAACMRAQNHLDKTNDAAAFRSRPQVNIVIIGGGATGVELSAELRNTAQVLGAYGLHRLDPRRDVHITIVEASPRILAPLPEHVAQETARTLDRLDVHMLTGERVTEVREHAVVTASGKTLPADLTVWAAGIQVPKVLADLGLPVNKLGQVKVSQTLQTEIDPTIFAFGDCADCPWPKGDNNAGRSVPPRAQAAHQQAKHLYHALQDRIDGRPLRQFVYRDRGSLISLSRFNAVGNLMGKVVGRSMLIEGALARLLYVSLYRTHLMALHGFMRMMLDTIAQWARRRTMPRVKLH